MFTKLGGSPNFSKSQFGAKDGMRETELIFAIWDCKGWSRKKRSAGTRWSYLQMMFRTITQTHDRLYNHQWASNEALTLEWTDKELCKNMKTLAPYGDDLEMHHKKTFQLVQILILCLMLSWIDWSLTHAVLCVMSLVGKWVCTIHFERFVK